MHIGLASHYTEGMLYQDNILPDMNIRAGHKVIFITDTYMYVDGALKKTKEEDTILHNGVRLVRLEYDHILCQFVTNKIQKVHKLKKYLNDFGPDSIMYHGVCGYELMDVADYVRDHPNVLFYVDSHEDFNNTARNWIAKFSYKYIHGIFVKKAISHIRKILYLAESSREYLKDMYHIADKQLEFYPLGGIITSIEEQHQCREKVIRELGLRKDVVICSHSGKLDPLKRTKELIKAFRRVNNDKLVLLIFGFIPPDQEEELMGMIRSDSRVLFLGWKTGDEITELLNATDVYCQPGSVSATSQVALCCGCAEIVAPIKSYEMMYDDAVMYGETVDEIKEHLFQIAEEGEYLEKYKEKGYKKAKEILDYSKLAERYLK